MTASVHYLAANADRRRSIAALDRRLSAAITVSTDPEAVVDRLAAEPVDCLVVDHAEPALDAIAVVERVRDRYPSLPAVVVASEGSESLATAALRAGATDYVRQSAGTDALVERIERILSASPRREVVGTEREPGCCGILDAIGDAVAVYDPADGVVVNVNERLCELVGCRHETACACSIETLRADGSTEAASTAEVVERTLERGTQQVEWRCETDDGEQFWAAVTFEPVTDQDRRYVVAVFRDVTDRKRRKQRLQSFRQAVERAGHSIYVTDTDGTIEYVNPAFERVTGFTAEEAIGNTPRMLKSGVHDREFYRRLWETILTGDVWENQLTNRRKDGETYVVNQTIAPITDEDGQIVNFVAVNADITAQKRRERQLRRLHDAVCEWLEADSPEAVASRTSDQLEDLLDLDLHGIFLYDEAADELQPAAVSATADDVIDDQPRFGEDDGIAWEVFETGREAIHDDVREAANVYNPETTIRSEMALPLGDHGVLLVGSRSTDAFDESDRTVASIVASSLEATLDRIAREQALERQKVRFEKFASVVSHDLRNPLTVAMGELERARDLEDPAAFDRVAEAHERIAAIIDDLLALARDGREIDDREPVPLGDVATAAWEQVEAEEASIEIECEPTRRVLADPGRLQQLFENLFRNAVEHGTAADSIEDSALTVTVGCSDDGFSVADTGRGIPEEKREAVLETGYTTADDGTGLGLSIVTTIVEAHGWSIDVTEGETGGARFEIGAEFVDAPPVRDSIP